MKAFSLSTAMLALAAISTADPSTFFTRPDIHGDKVVFTAEGDLWLSNLTSHETRRLTSDPAVETNSKFSPDGSMIAFNATYGGQYEVYVMPSEGGAPKQLTYGQVANRVEGWSPDGKSILVASANESRRPLPKLFTVPVKGGTPSLLPIPQGFFGSIGPDGNHVAFVPDSNEWMNWFRYQAGEADQIWVSDIKTGKFKNFTAQGAGKHWVNTTPVWVGDKIYFVSERTGVRNLWELNPSNGVEKQLTFSTTVPVRYPGSDGKNVVFEEGPQLGIYNVSTGKASLLSIDLHSDQIHTLPQTLPLAPLVSNVALGPSAKRVALVVRGQLITAATKEGELHRIISDSNQRVFNAVWSPNGKEIAYISDASGEEQLWTASSDGTTPPRQLTKELKGEHFQPVYSPDGNYILLGNHEMAIQLVNAKTGEVKTIEQADRGGSYDNPCSDYTFSPDSKWVAFSNQLSNWQSGVYLYEIATGKSTLISDPEIASGSPSFSVDGKYLFMIQNRSLTPINSAYNAMLSYDNTAMVTGVTLAKNTPSPFAVKDEEEGSVEKAPEPAPSTIVLTKTDAKGNISKTTETAKVTPPPAVATGVNVKIDLDGIQSRLVDMKMPPGHYSALVAVPGKLMILDSAFQDVTPGGKPSTLFSYDLKSHVATPFAMGVTALSLNQDKTQVALTTPAGTQVVPTGAPAVSPGEGAVKLAGYTITIDPKKEWHQVFEEGWRIARDFFYDPNMHGVNWTAVRAKYESQLPGIADRTDLTTIMGNMLAELNTGHCYVGGPNPYQKPSIPVGYLGAKVSYSDGALKIDHIYQSSSWDLNLKSPLSGLGLNVNDGDYIVEIGGEKVTDETNLEEVLTGLAGKVVSLKVNSKPTSVGARELFIEPIPLGEERALMAADWVESRKAYVAKASGGKLAYVHISDMEENGANDFAKDYYANVEKPGMIIDVRGNGGGYISANILNQLSAKTIGFFKPRYGASWRRETWGPLGSVVGITDQWAFSDGELFSEYFKRMKIGPLVGHRTGGGEVGSGGGYHLMDGGVIYVPNYGAWATDGSWLVEGHGAVPDVQVDQDPAEVMAGRDPQLDKAIQILMDSLKSHPFVIPVHPPFNVKTGGSRG